MKCSFHRIVILKVNISNQRKQGGRFHLLNIVKNKMSVVKSKRQKISEWEQMPDCNVLCECNMTEFREWMFISSVLLFVYSADHTRKVMLVCLASALFI